MYQPLAALVKAVTEEDRSPQWIFAGDYVNRGPDSKGVIDFLLQLPNARFCRGNHDDIFDLIVNGQCFVQEVPNNSRTVAFKWFMEHGLADTFASYGVGTGALIEILSNPSSKSMGALAAKVPSSHRQFVRQLLPVVEEDDIFVTHARWDPATPDEDPSITTFLEVDTALRKVITWGRFTAEELDVPKAWRRTGFFGHTPVDSYGSRGGYDPRGGGKLVPIFGDKMVLLDTAAALSPVGRLSAHCPELQKTIQVDRDGKPVT